WRCDSALIYYARTSWFVRTTAYKARLLETNREVDWHPPEVGTGRFGEWLENNVDWALSRDRYWGTPLNIWECDRDREHREVMGAYAELAERWGKPLPAGFDPHKPQIDGYTWQVIEEHGADAVRLYLLGQSQVWLPKRFDARQIPELAGGFLNSVRNTYSFFQLYAGDWQAEPTPPPSEKRPLVDRWLVARL